MKACKLFVKCLENEGVEYIFGVPGEEVIDLLHSISKSKIKFITTRHEEGAAFMANVYGRLTGKPGVCLSTLGPGATNLITGVADAYLDKAPLVAITGQTNLSNLHKESHQYINIAHIYTGVTKWNFRIKDADSIPEIVRKAFRIASSEKPGATHIELPEDIACADTTKKPLELDEIPQFPVPKSELIKKALTLIRDSKNPVILAGNAVIRGNASDELTRFSKKFNIPVITTFMGKGAISSRERLYVGTVGLHQRDYAIYGIDRADLVIALGTDVAEYSPRYWNTEKNNKIIHIDYRTPEVDEYYQTSLNLIGDIKETLRLLLKGEAFKKDSKYFTSLRICILGELDEYKDDKNFPLKPQKIIYDLRKALADDDILISDVGAHKIWLCRLYPTYSPNTFIVSNGYAAMGIALPGAIAAKIAMPERRVVAATGDGGFLMNLQELETAVRLGLDFVILIFNDSTYGLIQWKQINKFGEAFGVKFTNPDFVKLAESFGAKGYRVEKAEDLSTLLEEALNSKGVSIVDVQVDFSENLKLSEKLGKLVCPT